MKTLRNETVESVNPPQRISPGGFGDLAMATAFGSLPIIPADLRETTTGPIDRMAYRRHRHYR
jgi:hypothetical protein